MNRNMRTDHESSGHVFQHGRFTGAMTCERCGLLPLDQDDIDTPCREVWPVRELDAGEMSRTSDDSFIQQAERDCEASWEEAMEAAWEDHCDDVWHGLHEEGLDQ